MAKVPYMKRVALEAKHFDGLHEQGITKDAWVDYAAKTGDEHKQHLE